MHKTTTTTIIIKINTMAAAVMEAAKTSSSVASKALDAPDPASATVPFTSAKCEVVLTKVVLTLADAVATASVIPVLSTSLVLDVAVNERLFVAVLTIVDGAVVSVIG